jgi:hypothetical protein
MKSNKSWKEELSSWCEERSRTGDSRMNVENLAALPRARLTNLIECCRLARLDEEIWGKFEALDTRLKSGSLTQKEYSEGDFDENYEASILMSEFVRWFRMKNNIKEMRAPYSSCYLVLKKMAQQEGKMDMNEMKASFLEMDNMVVDDT